MHIITTHKNTDFDALASVIAGILLYPDAVGVIPKAVNNNVGKFLATHKTAFNLVLPKEIDYDKIKRLTVVDTNQWCRIDRAKDLKIRKNIEINLWDHHQNGGDIEADWVCQEIIGATVTLLIREMKRRKLSLNPLLSTVLLIGLYEDTGHLSFPSTKPEDALAAAYLLENGADLNVATVYLNPPYEENQKDILFTMMQNTEKIKHNNYIVGVNIIRLEQKVPMLAAIVSMYRKIINAEAVFIIFINDETSSTVIGRSGVDRIDIGALLQKLGGGGHAAAGSATVKSKNFTPQELKNRIIELIKENRTSGTLISDMMSFPVAFISPDTPMREVREIMQEKKIRGVLIGDESNLQGIIVESDFKRLRQKKHWDNSVKAFMVRDVATTKPDILPSQVAQFMGEKNIGHIPVEQDGKIVGIITRTDILNYFYGNPTE